MSRPYLLGLTGSIGMGKSTTAAMFAEHGADIWDADAAVHRIYAEGGAAVAPLAALRPDAIVNGAVDRARLKAWISKDPTALAQIESVVHPLVAADRAAFIATSTAELVVCDIPLLFETGSEGGFDSVAVVSAPAAVQRHRVLARPGMTVEHFERLRANQMSDAEKRARADHVIPTKSLEGARRAVADIVKTIGAGRADAGNRAGYGDDGA